MAKPVRLWPMSRIVGVGWGGSPIVLGCFGNADENIVVNGTTTPPPFPELDLMLTLSGDQTADESWNIVEELLSPDTPQPPDFEPLPPLEFPPSKAMVNFYRVFSQVLTITEDTGSTFEPEHVNIIPDYDPISEVPFWIVSHPDAGAASAYINDVWRVENPGWAGIGWFINTIPEVRQAFSARVYQDIGVHFPLPKQPKDSDGVINGHIQLPAGREEHSGADIEFRTYRVVMDGSEPSTQTISSITWHSLEFDELENPIRKPEFRFTVAADGTLEEVED